MFIKILATKPDCLHLSGCISISEKDIPFMAVLGGCILVQVISMGKYCYKINSTQ